MSDAAPAAEGGAPAPARIAPAPIFLNVLVIATCGLVYELLAGTLASYVLGDSVTEFSLVIGVYLSAMGVGAWLSRMLPRDLARRFVEIELGIALAGGLSAPMLFYAFAVLSWFRLALLLVVGVIGILVGLELPLLMRLLKGSMEFKELVGRVFTFDYIGALVASLLFPMVLVPKLGLVRTSVAFGLLNALVGLWGTYLFAPMITGKVLGLRVRAGVVIAILLAAFVKADLLTSLAEEQMFADEVVYAKTTAYQRIVVTRGRAGFQLFLNGHLQFASADEYRYHESLVHPVFAAARHAPESVLVLGGGDGLALREIEKYPSVKSITLVDLDPQMTELSNHFPPLAELNRHSFQDPRVHVVHADAFVWVQDDATTLFDAAIVDFPDPNSFALGKLYTTRFYRMLEKHLAPEAVVSVQSTSPLFARASYWCIVRTMEAAGFHVAPYQTTVPSFGVWGFALASKAPLAAPEKVPAGIALKFLDDATLASLFVMPHDAQEVPAEINRLDNQMLVRYYETEWRRWE